MQWHEVLADKSLHDLPYKIELNEKGLIIMSPASFIHSLLQGRLTKSNTSGKAGGLILLTAQSGLIYEPPKGGNALKKFSCSIL